MYVPDKGGKECEGTGWWLCNLRWIQKLFTDDKRFELTVLNDLALLVLPERRAQGM